MPAVIKENFANGFLLKEENARRIHEIIRKRLSPQAVEGNLQIRVIRKDHVTYTSDDIGVLFKENNSTNDKIERVDFFINTGKQWDDLHLKFDHLEGVYFYYEHDDRDLAFLLFSDVKSYINSDVTVLRKVRRKEDLNFLLMTLMVPIMLFSAAAATMPSLQYTRMAKIDEAIGGSDMMLKINMILELQKSKQFDKVPLYMFGFMFLYVVGFLAVKFLIKKYYPVNVFCFGKESERYDDIVRQRSNIFWVIGVGMAVSIVATIICAKFL